MRYNNITLWYRLNKGTGNVEFNHIEDGYCDTQVAPTAKCDVHKSVWSGATWYKQAGQIDNNYKVTICGRPLNQQGNNEYEQSTSN